MRLQHVKLKFLPSVCGSEKNWGLTLNIPESILLVIFRKVIGGRTVVDAGLKYWWDVYDALKLVEAEWLAWWMDPLQWKA